jgi:hypothetical protein
MTKPRKGLYCAPSIRILLGQAQPLWSELQGEKDPRKRRARERERDLAKDELLRIWWRHARHGTLDQLPRGLTAYCEGLRYRNGGQMPRARGGRPEDLHRRLLIWFSVSEYVVARNRQRGISERSYRADSF